MSRLAEVIHDVFSPSPTGLIVGILLILTIPLFLHIYVYRASSQESLPSIVLLGPSGSGKTSFLTLFERGQNAATHTSQAPVTVQCSLPVGTTAASQKYRSTSDPSNQAHKKFLLTDTPGHGKLRYRAFDCISAPQNLRGLIFLVDSANLSAGDEGLGQASEYLHDVLLLLQKGTIKSKLSKSAKGLSVLIGANKMDLFTALPVTLVRDTLEKEITKIRSSRTKRLLDSGVGTGDNVDDGENDEWLGEFGSSNFKFAQMEEFNISVEVVGGSLGPGSSDVEKWWTWIGERL